MCSKCREIIYLVQSTAGNAPLKRHQCYKDYIAKKNKEEKVKEESQSIEEEAAAETSAPELDLKEIVQGLTFASNDDDGSGGSGSNGGSGGDGADVGPNRIEDDGRSSSEFSDDDDDELTENQREILMNAIKQYGDNCAINSQSLGYTQLDAIVPHDISADAWDKFLESVNTLNITETVNITESGHPNNDNGNSSSTLGPPNADQSDGNTSSDHPTPGKKRERSPEKDEATKKKKKKKIGNCSSNSENPKTNKRASGDVVPSVPTKKNRKAEPSDRVLRERK